MLLEYPLEPTLEIAANHLTQLVDLQNSHASPKPLALHDFQLRDRGTVLAHRVVHEQPWQIEDSREPADHERDVEGLQPKQQHDARSASESVVFLDVFAREHPDNGRDHRRCCARHADRLAPRILQARHGLVKRRLRL